MAQPSMSEQIRRLEAELGVPLFTRAGRRLELTEAGRLLLPEAERTLAAAQAAQESVREVRDVTGGTVAFGTFGSAHHYLLGGLIEEFRRKHPSVRLRVVGQNSAEVADAVRDGHLEAGLVVLPVDDRGLDVRPGDAGGAALPVGRAAPGPRADDDREARRRAADPLRRPLGRRRPDAPPAARARAARRREDRARHRGRVHDRGPGPRPARPRRHDRRPRDRRLARARAALERRAVRPAALRDVRLHHAAQRAPVAGDARVHRRGPEARRGAAAADRRGAGGRGRHRG